MNDIDAAHAVFALGRFVQYRLDEGMDPSELVGYMQAYENIAAAMERRQPITLPEDAAHIGAAPDALYAVHGWPGWLVDHGLLVTRLQGGDQAG